jgi:glycine/D-amino acid oxidase-like deaminating enzyme
MFRGAGIRLCRSVIDHHGPRRSGEGPSVTGVRTASGVVSAPVVVNYAGLSAARLFAPLGIAIEITPTRHQMCFFRRPPGFGLHPGIVDRPHRTYMRPEHGDLTIHGVGS